MIKVSLHTAAAVALLAGAAFVISCSTPQPAGTGEAQGQAAASGDAPQYVYDPGWPKPLPNNWKIGGMKGRREEMTREQVHEILQKRLGVRQIHSEYGMTEILSQAYSRGNGIFKCPPWMKVLIRSEDDPFSLQAAALSTKRTETGIINIIDLANIYSCAFIATDDMGRLYHNGSFEVLGRCDNADIRGCSLLIS